MSWKDWPYWLRGGLIGLIIPVAILIIGIIVIIELLKDGGGFAFNVPAIFVILVLIFILSSPVILVSTIFKIHILSDTNFYSSIILSVIISLPIYFIIGAIIGFIYGKFKRNKPKEEIKRYG